jgi:hypothetical protein
MSDFQNVKGATLPIGSTFRSGPAIVQPAMATIGDDDERLLAEIGYEQVGFSLFLRSSI